MNRWLPDEVALLTSLAKIGVGAKECAFILGRSEGAVRAKAQASEVVFNGLACKQVRDHLASGAVLVREEVGGVIGVHWACASRSLGGFNARVCEALRDHGLLVPDERGHAVYCAHPDWLDTTQLKEAA